MKSISFTTEFGSSNPLPLTNSFVKTPSKLHLSIIPSGMWSRLLLMAAFTKNNGSPAAFKSPTISQVTSIGFSKSKRLSCRLILFESKLEAFFQRILSASIRSEKSELDLPMLNFPPMLKVSSPISKSLGSKTMVSAFSLYVISSFPLSFLSLIKLPCWVLKARLCAEASSFTATFHPSES
ncbi:hypothetical protein D3C86_1671690 [compost metagenome]